MTTRFETAITNCAAAAIRLSSGLCALNAPSRRGQNSSSPE